MALLALVLNLRPDDCTCLPYDQVELPAQHADRLRVAVWGDKTDSRWEGNVFHLPHTSDHRVCPVCAVRDYMELTRPHRVAGSNLFIELRPPFGDLSSDRCSNILTDTAAEAGLDPSIYTGSTYRKGGATAAINQGSNWIHVRRLGRWRDARTFLDHYVAPALPENYCDTLLGGGAARAAAAAGDDV